MSYDCCFLFYGHITRFSAKVTASKCQIEELREKGVPEDMLSKIQQGVIMSHLIHHRHSYVFLSVPSKACLEEQAPLKSALKRSSSQKPALKSILKKSPFHGNISPGYARLNMIYLTMVLGEKKSYYSEDESAKRERGTRDGLLFTVLISDRHNADRSSFQGEYFAGMGKAISEPNSSPQS